MANTLITGKLNTDRTKVQEISVNSSGEILTSAGGVADAAQAIADGGVFYGSDIIRSVADNADQEWLVVTGSVDAVVAFGVKSIGDYELSVFEDTTVTANGTVKTNFNAKRSDTTTTIETLIYESPTVTADGNQITESLNHGGEKNDVTATNDTGGLILKANSNYLIRYTNTSGNSVHIAISWRIVE